MLVGADILVGFGEIESDQLLILEQIVVDNEIAHLCQRLAEGVDSADEKDLFDDIARIGPGGSFSGRPEHTQSCPERLRFTRRSWSTAIPMKPGSAWVSPPCMPMRVKWWQRSWKNPCSTHYRGRWLINWTTSCVKLKKKSRIDMDIIRSLFLRNVTKQTLACG